MLIVRHEEEESCRLETHEKNAGCTAGENASGQPVLNDLRTENSAPL